MLKKVISHTCTNGRRRTTTSHYDRRTTALGREENRILVIRDKVGILISTIRTLSLFMKIVKRRVGSPVVGEPSQWKGPAIEIYAVLGGNSEEDE